MHVAIHHYDFGLVSLSIVIAILASYSALDLAGRVTATLGKTRFGWLFGGAVSMGIGIWAMHFIGMLASCLPMPVSYNWLIVGLSILPAIGASGVALFIVSQPQIRLTQMALGSTCMGLGIAAMHYSGMAAMQLSATIVYDLKLVAASIGIAIGVSSVALYLAFRLREQNTSNWALRRLASGILMGLAIPTMHYTGMAAISFTQIDSTIPAPSHFDTGILAITIGLGAGLILSLVLLSAFLDRTQAQRLAQTLHELQQTQSQLQSQSEQLQDYSRTLELKMAELDRNRAFLQAQRESSLDGILVVDCDRKINAHNQRFLDLWQVPLDLRTSQNDHRMLSHVAEQMPDSQTFFEEVLYFYDQIDRSDHRELKLKDGRTIERTSVPVNAANGESWGRIWYFREITERKRAEAEILQKTQDLEQALIELQNTQLQMVQAEKMSSLGQLVAGVAHEINNPVNFIHANLGYVEQYTQNLLHCVRLYQESYPTPVAEIQVGAEELELDFVQQDLPKILNSMRVGTERIRQIVLSLRNFSRLDESEFKAVDLHAGIDNTLLMLQHRLKATPERPAIQVQKEYGNLPLVECYAGQLNQVFMNILANAIDALDEQNAKLQPLEVQEYPSQIHIRTSVIEMQWVEIAISDNGIGVPEEVQHRIFDPFFTTKPIGKGTGIGMSISYQIVTERHGGRLKCCSLPGQGTEFRIEIPICQTNKSEIEIPIDQPNKTEAVV
jgi:NO-binding membrane sensor protein with MHYT domain/signal transduction histidine kinase